MQFDIPSEEVDQVLPNRPTDPTPVQEPKQSSANTVGFCNTIKKEKDRINHIWVVEATENSDYSLTYEHKRYIQLKHDVVASQKWAEVSSLTIEKLKQKVISIIGKRT
ncbi:hypothetical protein POM88_030870 [Heracleum sosnowskyi]|uniref:Uncharacterized protein n=1 Tax=Heracleum sosnowskyi TaxID=360622 RepID=A0AAD8HWB8_9APIA|nr:hypothetical protein POM88_030870 [Heracleum sosnowskyi]